MGKKGGSGMGELDESIAALGCDGTDKKDNKDD